MVLKVPRLNASPLALCDRPFSLLGFGDILVPGTGAWGGRPWGRPARGEQVGPAPWVAVWPQPPPKGWADPRPRGPRAFSPQGCSWPIATGSTSRCSRPGSTLRPAPWVSARPCPPRPPLCPCSPACRAAYRSHWHRTELSCGARRLLKFSRPEGPRTSGRRFRGAASRPMAPVGAHACPPWGSRAGGGAARRSPPSRRGQRSACTGPGGPPGGGEALLMPLAAPGRAGDLPGVLRGRVALPTPAPAAAVSRPGPPGDPEPSLGLHRVPLQGVRGRRARLWVRFLAEPADLSPPQLAPVARG